MSAPSFVAASGDVTTQLSLAVDKPTGLAENDVMLAVVMGGRYNTLPTITPPSGWTYIGDEYTLDTGSARRRARVYWKRAGSSEPDTYTWEVDGSQSDIYTTVCISISAYRGCRTDDSPIDQISSLDYTTSNKTVRCGSVTPEAKDVTAVLMLAAYMPGGGSGTGGATYNAPTGYTRRDEQWGGGTSSTALSGICDKDHSSASGTGDVDTAWSGISTTDSTSKRGWLVTLRPAQVAPGLPTMTDPADGFHTLPGDTLDLTASAANDGYPVAYKWTYDVGGGEVDIDTSEYVASGTSETIEWDTTGLAEGTYTLRCRAADIEPANLSTADTATLYLLSVVLVAPTDGAALTAGAIVFSARGYLTSAGDVAIRWEVDTNTPPDSGSDDYQTFDTAYEDQGHVASGVAVLGYGTWYFRACTLDTADPVNEGVWSEVYDLRVVEALRLLAGSEVKRSTLTAANRIYARVQGTEIEEIATFDEAGDPLAYSASPREDVVPLPDGDATGAATVAASTLARRRVDQTHCSGLEVSLEDGLKLYRGQQVGVQIDRLGVTGTFPIRGLLFDLAAGKCVVAIGDWQAPKSEEDILVALAQKVEDMRREQG